MRRRLALLATVAVLAAVGSAAAAGGSPGASLGDSTLPLATWTAATDNLVPVAGTLRLAGQPVAGARIAVDGYELPAATTSTGAYSYLADGTALDRHVVRVVDVARARVGGAAPTAAQRSALLAVRGAIDVAYPLAGLKVARDGSGNVVLTGTLGDASHAAPPTVALYSYQLTGKVLDAKGKPVVGARVSTRTEDRDYWTVSSPTTADGTFQSLFTASSESSGNPVPMTIRVSQGDHVWEYLPTEYAYFQRLESARVIVRLPPAGYPIALPVPTSYPGVIDQGVVVGVSSDGAVVKPVAASWPDRAGHFRLVLPRALRGRTVTLWEDDLHLFSATPARPGSAIDLQDWPRTLPPDAPQALVSVRLR